jgi:hypothetical protein
VRRRPLTISVIDAYRSSCSSSFNDTLTCIIAGTHSVTQSYLLAQSLHHTIFWQSRTCSASRMDHSAGTSDDRRKTFSCLILTYLTCSADRKAAVPGCGSSASSLAVSSRCGKYIQEVEACRPSAYDALAFTADIIHPHSISIFPSLINEGYPFLRRLAFQPLSRSGPKLY